MSKAVLPDFLNLTDDQIAREKERQDRLRRDFNSRVRMSPAENEMARAMVLEPELKKAVRSARGTGELRSAKSRYAEALAAQGRFLEASQKTSDSEMKKFFRKAADAVFNGRECSCSGPVEQIGGNVVWLPKYRVLKEIFSIRLGQFAYLVECVKCGNWAVVGSNPIPTSEEPVSDLKILKA